MTTDAPQDLQELCATGQEYLIQMEYLRAEAVLVEAERRAWAARDWDALSRLYMPLQETRRQRRQRCGEGAVVLDLIASGPQDAPDPQTILDRLPHGQLLVAGWGSIASAVDVRQGAAERGLYVETFLAAAYPTGAADDLSSHVIAIVPSADVALPDPVPRPVDELIRRLPPHAIVLARTELPAGARQGNTHTFAEIMALWERLHLSFLAAADMEVDPVRKMEGYRTTIRVDYACELAHQKLSNVAREMLRHASV